MHMLATYAGEEKKQGYPTRKIEFPLFYAIFRWVKWEITISKYIFVSRKENKMQTWIALLGRTAASCRPSNWATFKNIRHLILMHAQETSIEGENSIYPTEMGECTNDALTVLGVSIFWCFEI